jgi:hypothetical protein
MQHRCCPQGTAALVKYQDDLKDGDVLVLLQGMISMGAFDGIADTTTKEVARARIGRFGNRMLYVALTAA